MRRVVVTSGRSPLGRSVLEMLRSNPEIETVRAIESRASKRERDDDDIEIVPFVPDHRMIAEYLEKERIDTVIQCGLVRDRSGSSRTSDEADVIATMCLGAAVGHEGSPVRSWVLASSSAIYPVGSHSPLFQSESQEIPREDETLAASIAEAEDYARDVASRHPYVNVAILRLQQLAGEAVRGPLASLFARRAVPTPIGFDPAIQLLHSEDAASALVFAATVELAGVYNVASKGSLHWNDAIRATGNVRFPVLPLSVEILEPILERLGIGFMPSELQDLMRYGHVVDTAKIQRAGWRPRYDQVECLATLRAEEPNRGSRGRRARR